MWSTLRRASIKGLRTIEPTNAVRASSSAPSLAEIFPRKKFVSRQLFDLDSRLTYKKLYPVYNGLYQSLNEGGDGYSIPSYVSGADLLIMKKVLEKHRAFTNTINPHLVKLENVLIEKSAEKGDNDAISLLAVDTLTTKDTSSLNEGDKPIAVDLIKQLYKLSHPLTIKLLGDIAHKRKNYTEAKQYYLEFLDLEYDTVLSGDVYKQLGIIYFVYDGDLHNAKKMFLQSIKYAPLNKTLESHYFLGEIFLASDPQLARYHLQLAASNSFRSAFKSLGYLELNYFGNFTLAREWFKMGIEVHDYECLFGLFDSYTKFNKLQSAAKALTSIKRVFTPENGNEQLLEDFMAAREDEIEQIAQTNLSVDTNAYPSSAKLPKTTVF